VDTGSGGEGRTNWESSIDIYIYTTISKIQLVGTCSIAQGAQLAAL